MPTRRTVALIGFLALTALLCGWRMAAAQAGSACRNDAAPIDRPGLAAPPTLAPNTAYTVTWRLLNTGDCTWGDGYALTPMDAAALGDPSAPLTAAVAPGDTLTVTLTVSAPVTPGYHQGVWRLTDAAAAPFGPWLPLEIDVAGDAANADAAVGDVALPEVLAMSGFGFIAPDDALYYYEDPCLATGDAPAWVVGGFDYIGRERRRLFHLCNVTPDSAVTVTLTTPTGDVFTRTLTVPAPVDFTDANGAAYTRAILTVRPGWLADAAPGRWTLSADLAAGAVTVPFALAPLVNPASGASRWLDNLPVAPMDPFAAGAGCHYSYAAGEPFFITGHGFPPAAPVQLGVYETRLGVYYFAERLQVVTDAAGSFRKLATAGDPGQAYSVYLLDRLDPAAFAPDGVSYDPFLPTDGLASLTDCYTVRPTDAAPPLRVAFASGAAGAAEIGYFAPDSAWIPYVTQGFGACDAGAPAWTADGGLVYHSNCAGSYDLYRHPDPRALDALDAPEVTATPILTTPDFDETDPAVAADGRIVFRRAPAGTELTAAGELWQLDPGATEPVALGIQGHAPAWSPDGTQIAYMADSGGTWQVYVYDVATATAQLVSVACPGHCRYPAWSPDGMQLVYSATVAGDDLTPAGLWLATLADGAVVPWHSGAYDRPDWSATGWVIFTGPDGLYRARPDRPTPAPARYLRDPAITFGDPAWSY